MAIKDFIRSEMRRTVLDSDVFAESIVYKPASAEGEDGWLTLTAVVNRQLYSQEYTEDGEGVRHLAEVQISSDGADGVAAPTLNDLVTLDTQDWKLVEIETDDGSGLHRLTVMRYEAIDRSGQNARVRRR